jgi:hypothetical protein
MLLLQLQAVPRVRLVRLVGTLRFGWTRQPWCGGRQTLPLVGTTWWVSRDELQPAGEATPLRVSEEPG